MSASTGTTVTVLVVALVVLGVAMIGVAVWLVRATRSDPPALGPLEVMGARRFRRGNADRRQTKLDTARPAGAPPPAPIVPFEPADGNVALEGNGEPSMQESAVSAHSSPEEQADAASEAGEGDVPEAHEHGLEPDGAPNGEPSMQESAVSAHSSPVEQVDAASEAGDGDGDGKVMEAPEPVLEPDGAGIGELSMQESAVSAHSSPDERADAGSEVGDGDGDLVGDSAANSDASMQESAVSDQSSPEEPTNSEPDVEANTKE